jgi:hypothetical protein
MQRKDSSPSQWFFLPPGSTPLRAFRRSNLIAIAILVFFSVGLLLIGLIPGASGTRGSALATHHSQPKIGRAAPAHHVR